MKPSMQLDPDGMTGDPYKDSGKNYKLKVQPKICEVCGAAEGEPVRYLFQGDRNLHGCLHGTVMLFQPSFHVFGYFRECIVFSGKCFVDQNNHLHLQDLFESLTMLSQMESYFNNN